MLDFSSDLCKTVSTGSQTSRWFAKGWGAEFIDDHTVRFRIWAPALDRVTLRLAKGDLAMRAAEDGWFELVVDGIAAGSAYRYVLPDGTAVPDPASRAQAGGIGGPSLIVDPEAYRWSDAEWHGRPWEEAVVYETHIGTFTAEGTFAAAERRLARLADIGFTAIELMPVSQFLGNHGWGYDGVLPYSPHHAYGPPEAMKSFVDAAHRAGLMVMLDVVYNHFGPLGNFLPLYAPGFFKADRHTGWGQSIDFSTPAVRQYFIENALYWLVEFNLDGLRLDAVHTMEDDASPVHILAELSARVARTCRGRRRHLTLEDSHNGTRLLARGAEPGSASAYDAAWNDDLHHAWHVIATGESCGYFTDFAEDSWEKAARALAGGFIYQKGQTADGAAPAGPAPASLPPTTFIDFLQNHDQIGNRPFGDRMQSGVDAAMMRALTAVLLLGPHIPLLFQGDDYGERRPFMFFVDATGDLARAIRAGRFAEAGNYGGVPEGTASPDDLPDPSDPAVFARSKLNWAAAETTEGRAHAAWLARLLACRRRYIVPALPKAGPDAGRVVASGENLIAVDWQLDGCLLQIRANLGQTPIDIPEAEGRLVHAEPSDVRRDGSGRLVGPAVLVYVLATPAAGGVGDPARESGTEAEASRTGGDGAQ